MPPTAGCKIGFICQTTSDNETTDHPGNTKLTSTTPNPINSKDYSQQNHISNSRSNMSLRQSALNDANKSKSVTSLSVGVQCNPCDVYDNMSRFARSSTGDIIKANSRTALLDYMGNADEDEENDISISSSLNQGNHQHDHGNCRHHQYTRRSAGRLVRHIHPKGYLEGYGIHKHLHFSDPDFRNASHEENDGDFIPLLSSQQYYNQKKEKARTLPYFNYHLEESERYNWFVFPSYTRVYQNKS